MNGDGPLLSLDPSADGVSYAPVLHRVSLDPNQQSEQCAVALDEARRIVANIAKLPTLLKPPTALMPYFLTPLS